MFARFRISLGLALVVGLLTFNLAFAKGGFAFITIRGTNLTEPIRVTDSALTEDFFAFADFYRAKTQAPANAGAGYEVTRYYINGNQNVAFDQLHYYPDSGYVYYDGIVNGDSEYDGGWYTAKPEMRAIFESALAGLRVPAPQSVQPAEQAQDSSRTMDLSRLILPIVATLGLALLLMLALSRRNVSA